MNTLKHNIAKAAVIGLTVSISAFVSAEIKPMDFAETPALDDLAPEYSGPVLTSEYAESIMSIVQTEGLDYAFSHYAIYRDVNDMKFHELRQKYIEAAKEIRQYVESKVATDESENL